MGSSSIVRRLSAAWFAAGLAFCGAIQSVAQTGVEVSPEELRLSAHTAEQAGQSEAAIRIVAALLERDPEDTVALIVLSRAERDLGRYNRALIAARKAWRLAPDENGRFAAAMAIAQAQSSAGNRTMGQFWLRRAADIAPNDDARAVAIRDFRYVRARNPWAAEFSFNVTPTNNVNNGSARETSQLFGLPLEFQLSATAQALSGYEISGGVAGRYRFTQDARHAQDITYLLNHRTYLLSEEAKAAAPGVKGSDFAFSQLALGYNYHRTPENWPGPFSLSLTGGNTWYAGNTYFSFLRVGGQQSFRFSDKTVLTLFGTAERQFGEQAPDVDRLNVTLRLNQQIGQLGVLGLTVGNTTSISASDTGDFSEQRVGADFRIGKPIAGIDVSFGLDWRGRDFVRSRFDPAGRRDNEVTGRVNLVFRQIDRFGFNPTVTVQSSRTDSTIGLFDREKTGVQIGIRSSF